MKTIVTIDTGVGSFQLIFDTEAEEEHKLQLCHDGRFLDIHPKAGFQIAGSLMALLSTLKSAPTRPAKMDIDSTEIPEFLPDTL